MTGAATNSSGRIFAITGSTDDAVDGPHLIEIDPVTGGLLNDVGRMTTALGISRWRVKCVVWLPGQHHGGQYVKQNRRHHDENKTKVDGKEGCEDCAHHRGTAIDSPGPGNPGRRAF